MIAVIDLDSVAYYAGHGKKIQISTTEDGLPIYKREGNRLVYEDKSEDELKQSCDDIMTDILSRSQATGYIAYIKGKNTGKHRYEVNPDYKSNRSKEVPKWWNYVKDYLETKWRAVSVDDYEVDDYVATTVKLVPDSFIVAIDKDLLHLEGTHYNWSTNEWITTSKEEAELHFWTDMLVGQPGDGLKGVPKIGKKGAEKLLSNLELKKGLEDINYSNIVYQQYVDYFNNNSWIEYFKTYKCLKIKEDLDIEIPKITEFNILDQLEKGFDEGEFN